MYFMITKKIVYKVINYALYLKGKILSKLIMLYKIR
jgi:hypothetical protein